jgi:sensor histidine kinase YesM
LLAILAVRVLNRRERRELSVSYWLVIVFVPLASIYLLQYVFFLHSGIEQTTFYEIITITVLLSINILNFYVYDRLQKHYEVELANKNLEMQINSYIFTHNLKANEQRSARKAMHDFRNMLLGLRVGLVNNGTEKTLATLDKLLGDVSLSGSANTGNLAIDSMITYKENEAIAKNIKFSISAKIPSSMAVDYVDIGVIIGSLLDNAIEACGMLNHAEKLISIQLGFSQGVLHMSFSNPYESEIIKDADGALLTTKMNRDEHGIGLKSLARIVDKNGGDYKIDFSDGVFSISVTLVGIELDDA